jgi:glycosyltransferase involved in cell wall biosynthesis
MATVAVIVPNYYHAAYLPLRIESILGQTYQDFELLILDDKSPDNSIEVIERYRADSRVKVHYNTQNSGSTYQQWKKGIALTHSQYIWIAESDDYAAPRFLDRLVTQLTTHPTAGIAVCESIVVDSENRSLGRYSDLFHNNFEVFPLPSVGADFFSSGREYCQNYMVPWNTIPNASAVLFRRAALDRIGGPAIDLTICGDWMTYCKILMEFDIARIPESLNFFRTHSNNMRSRTKSMVFFREQREVRNYVRNSIGIREKEKYRWPVLGFESELIISAERQPPSNKVPLQRFAATLGWTIGHGLGLWVVVLGRLIKEQGAELLKMVGMRAKRSVP